MVIFFRRCCCTAAHAADWYPQAVVCARGGGHPLLIANALFLLCQTWSSSSRHGLLQQQPRPTFGSQAPDMWISKCPLSEGTVAIEAPQRCPSASAPYPADHSAHLSARQCCHMVGKLGAENVVWPTPCQSYSNAFPPRHRGYRRGCVAPPSPSVEPKPDRITKVHLSGYPASLIKDRTCGKSLE
jgi:hypothetical protein